MYFLRTIFKMLRSLWCFYSAVSYVFPAACHHLSGALQ